MILIKAETKRNRTNLLNHIDNKSPRESISPLCVKDETCSDNTSFAFTRLVYYTPVAFAQDGAMLITCVSEKRLNFLCPAK